MNKLLGVSRLTAHKTHGLCIAWIAATALMLWLLGSPEFKFRSPPNTLNLTQLHSNAALWSRKGEIGEAEFSVKGVTLKLEETAKLQLQASQTFNWNLDAAAGAEYLLITAQLEALSDEKLSDNGKLRPALSVRLRTDGERKGAGMSLRASNRLLGDKIVKYIKPRDGSNELQIFWMLFSPGHWRLQDVAIRSVYINPYYYGAMAATLVPFAIGCLIAVKFLMSRMKLVQLLLLNSIVVIALASTSMARSTMAQFREGVLIHLPFPYLAEFWLTHVVEVQKAGHVMVFMLLTLVAFLSCKPLSASRLHIIGYLAVLALLTEAMQRHSIGRTPRLEDVGLDLIGICFGFFVFLAVKRVSAWVN